MSPFSTVETAESTTHEECDFLEFVSGTGRTGSGMKLTGRYTTVVLTTFEERAAVDCMVDCLSASGLNPLVGNSGARVRSQSGIYLKSNRKYKKKM